MSLEVGTTIFNERGDEREVALDKRDKGGKLWAVASWGQGDSREQLKRGSWFAKNGENAALHMFVQATETAIEPLQDAERALSKRTSALRSFARLLASVAEKGTAYVSLISDVRLGRETSAFAFEGELAKELGEPSHAENSHWLTYYEATVTGLPLDPVIKVTGTNGKTVAIHPPEDFGEIYCG